MPEFQFPTLAPRAVVRPRCPQCQASTTVQRAIPSRRGFEHWTLRCTKCGLIHEAQVDADPMKSGAGGWTDSNLNPPT
jgi:transcription elongation factor Elf1